ncbi:MAG: hypothetical protein ABW085_16800 [Sedimenticola sp.]
MRVLLITTLIWVTSFAQAAEQKYLCIADGATGFRYDETAKSWGVVTYSTESLRYIVAKAKGSYAKHSKYTITRIGDSYAIQTCKKDFSESGLLVCDDELGYRMFSMNSRNLRYAQSSSGLYPHAGMQLGEVLVSDSNADAPYVEIGKCSPL